MCPYWKAIRVKRLSALALLALMQTGAAQAAATADMVFYGTLNAPPPCTINNGQTVEVDFGDRVGVSKVDGKNYLQLINYRITCEQGGGGMALGLTLFGPVSGFDTAALQTNIPDLAHRILQNGQPLELNKRIDIAIDSPPMLQAVPVKRAGAELPSGEFSVTATLLADYL
ncbi:fimbrial protein [Serratia marcescens]|uniref:fimbrial protein n=1 Tax=Serratia marcescens TaxID=615 RepID=UPI001FD61126|nr:fimbrial protein [Serratia marcescens]